MGSATEEARSAFTSARVGVLAFVAADGTPRACAVTPYVDGDDALVTSTLTYLAKVRSLHRDPRAAILAGGVEVRGEVALALDLSAEGFDRHVRGQELAKYPPSRMLLRIPGHRRLLWWYVGRGFARLPLASARSEPGSDRTTVTFLDAGLPTVRTLAPDLVVDDDAIALGIEVPDGPTCLLVHDEDASMADLRQLVLVGDVRDAVLHVRRRRGSLEPSSVGTLDQLRDLRRLARSARAARPDAQRLAGAIRAERDGRATAIRDSSRPAL